MSNYGPETPRDPQEALELVDMIDWIHGIRDHFSSWDNQYQPLQNRLNVTRLPYVPIMLPSEIAPVLHRRLAMRPIPGRQPFGRVSLVYFRIPTPYYLRETADRLDTDYETVDTAQRHDIFIELCDDQNVTLDKYLLNGTGLFRYETASNGGPIPTDIMRNYVDYEESGDFFISVHEPDTPPKGPIFDLKGLRYILDNYIPMPQEK